MLGNEAVSIFKEESEIISGKMVPNIIKMDLIIIEIVN